MCLLASYLLFFNIKYIKYKRYKQRSTLFSGKDETLAEEDSVSTQEELTKTSGDTKAGKGQSAEEKKERTEKKARSVMKNVFTCSSLFWFRLLLLRSQTFTLRMTFLVDTLLVILKS